MRTVYIALAIGLLFLFSACSAGAVDEADSFSHQTITAEEARRIMAETEHFILLDVRTLEEFQEERIEGAILIPYNEIMRRAEIELPDKDAVILIYCRAGRRSAIAAASLSQLGFSAVYDFGGIIDWSFETASN